MALMVPRDMPTTGAALQAFEVQRVDYHAPEAGGTQGGVQAGFPLWAASWTIGRIGEDRSDLWRAWFTRMRGSQRRFLARDLRRPYPKLYPGGFTGLSRPSGGGFNGAAASWSVAIDVEGDCLLTLNDLPAGLLLSLGDYVGFRWDDPAGSAGNWYRRALVRVIEPATADGTGKLVARVEPPVPSLVPPTAPAHLDQPACVMKMLSDQSNLDVIDRRGAIRGGTIVAVQDLRP